MTDDFFKARSELETDPFIRQEYQRRLASEGVEFTMPDTAFEAASSVAAD